MLKIVADTNLIVSAVITSHGNSARVLELFRKNLIEIVISEEITIEIQRVLNYPKIRKRHGWSLEETKRFIKWLKKFCIIVVPKAHSDSIVKQDVSDDKFLDCAAAGEVDYIVSGDKHFLNLEKYQGIKIVKPADFIRILKHQKDTRE